VGLLELMVYTSMFHVEFGAGECGDNHSHPLSYHHLYRRHTDMDEIRGSLSRLKKKLKHRLIETERHQEKSLQLSDARRCYAKLAES